MTIMVLRMSIVNQTRLGIAPRDDETNMVHISNPSVIVTNTFYGTATTVHTIPTAKGLFPNYPRAAVGVPWTIAARSQQ